MNNFAGVRIVIEGETLIVRSVAKDEYACFFAGSHHEKVHLKKTRVVGLTVREIFDKAKDKIKEQYGS